MSGSQDLSLKVLLQAQNLAGGAFSSFGNMLGNLSGVAGIAATGLLAVGGAAIAVGVNAVQMAAEYDRSMRMVQALTGASADQMKQYDAGLKALAIDSGVGPTKLSQGLYYVISAGYSGADAMKLLTLSTRDAVIGLTDSKITASALTTVMQGFNKSIKDADKVNGEMLRTVTLGKMSMQDYAGAVSKVAVLHAQYKVTLEDTNATLATLTSSGYKSAAIAATGYSQLVGIMDGKTDLMTKRIDKMLGSTTGYVKVLKDVHGQMTLVTEKTTIQNKGFDEAYFKTLSYSGQLDYLNKVMAGHYDQLQNVLGGSKQAASAFTTLETHSKMFKDNLKALSDQQKNATATQEAWAITQGGFTQTMNRAGAAVQVLMITIGQALLPVLTSLGQQIIPLITGFTTWLTKSGFLQQAANFLAGTLQVVFTVIGTVISKIAGLVGWLTQTQTGAVALYTVLGVVATILSVNAVQAVTAFVAAIPGVISGFVAWAAGAWATAAANIAAFWPIYLVVAGIILIIGLVVLAVKNWGAIAHWLQGVWAALSGFFVGLFNSIMTALSPLISFFKTVFSIIFAIVQVAIVLLINYWLLWFNVVKAIVTPIIAFFKWLWNGIVAIFSVVGGWFAQQFQKVTQGITFFVQVNLAMFKWLWNGLVAIFSPIVSFLGGMFQKAWAVIQAVFGPAVKWFGNLWKGISDAFTSVFNSLGGIAQTAWNGVLNILKGGVNFFIGIINHLIDGYNNLPKFGAPNLPHIPTLAAGGFVPPGSVAIAGEAGPEFVFGGRSGATVVSTSQTAALMHGGGRGRGGGGHTFIHNGDIIIHVPSGNPREIYEYIKREQSRELRRSGSISTSTSGGRAAS